MLAEILRTHPAVRGEVLDLAPSAAAAAERFAAAGLADRAGAVPGSFFDPLPPGADAYVLSDGRTALEFGAASARPRLPS